MKFVPQPNASKRQPNNTIAVKLPPELIQPFYALCEKTGLSPSRLGHQMIKFSLDNMK
jgi:hypothetical protein